MLLRSKQTGDDEKRQLMNAQMGKLTGLIVVVGVVGDGSVDCGVISVDEGERRRRP